MVRKSFAAVVLLGLIAAPAVAAVRERRSRGPRTPGESVVRKIVRVIEGVVGNSDGISIPKP